MCFTRPPVQEKQHRGLLLSSSILDCECFGLQAIAGCLKGVPGKNALCGLAVVQLGASDDLYRELGSYSSSKKW